MGPSDTLWDLRTHYGTFGHIMGPSDTLWDLRTHYGTFSRCPDFRGLLIPRTTRHNQIPIIQGVLISGYPHLGVLLYHTLLIRHISPISTYPLLGSGFCSLTISNYSLLSTYSVLSTHFLPVEIEA